MDDFSEFARIVKELMKRNHAKQYLIEMLLISVLASLTGRSSYDSFEQFAHANFEPLRNLMRFKNGPPSQFAFSDLFDALDPEQIELAMKPFMKPFMEAISGNQTETEVEVPLSPLKDISKGSPLHLVQAFLPGAGLAFGQLKVDGKSNETTAMPALLDILSLVGRTVVVYALHTQRDVSARIVERGGAYVVPVGPDQRLLHEDVQLWIGNPEALKEMLSYQPDDRWNARNETLKATVSHNVSWLQERHDWPDLKAVGMIEVVRKRKGQPEHRRPVRHFIMSREITPERLLNLTRIHLKIKNRFRWVLDVVIDEDRKNASQ